MIINCETEFNIGDEVFCISREPKNNDYYCTDSVWRVYQDPNSWTDDYESLKITNIIIKVSAKHEKILYQFDNTTYEAGMVFRTLEEAIKECERLNREEE